MKVYTILLAIAFCLSGSLFAQTPVNKVIPVQSGQKVTLTFDYPKLIVVSTWDKNEIAIQGTVSINNGESDNAFILESTTSGNVITIKGEIKDMKNLPQRYTIEQGGQKITFRDQAELKKYQAEHGGAGFDRMYSGVDTEIVLEIKIPKNMETRVESVYGLVEIKGFNGPLAVQSTYGGVDAALTERAIGQVIAETDYGTIYTNFDTKFGGDRMEDFHTSVSATPGAGPKYSFISKYGNVYLRKGN